MAAVLLLVSRQQLNNKTTAEQAARFLLRDVYSSVQVSWWISKSSSYLNVTDHIAAMQVTTDNT